MLNLGELERACMELLWESPGSLTAAQIREAFPGRKLAVTTILTVLSRLETKGFVTRTRTARPHQYQAVSSRETHMAELMRDVLERATDRTAVLEHFIGQTSEDEADVLRRILGAGY